MLKVFCLFMKTQFDKKVLTIRTNNGLEFYNQCFYKMVKDHGILHESSCAYAP